MLLATSLTQSGSSHAGLPVVTPLPRPPHTPLILPSHPPHTPLTPPTSFLDLSGTR